MAAIYPPPGSRGKVNSSGTAVRSAVPEDRREGIQPTETKMPPRSDPKNLLAVIDIGSSALRLVIAEIASKEGVRHLENLQMHVPLGKDVFTTGRISTASLREALRVLRNYRSRIDEYGVKHIHAIATSAVREAANRDSFVDRVFVRTGIEIEVIEGAEENRLGMIAVEHALRGAFDFECGSCLLVEVGSGATVLIELRGGEVALTRTLTIGSVRLPGNVLVGSTDREAMRRLLARAIHEIAEHGGGDVGLHDVDTFIAPGATMRFLARKLCPERDQEFVALPVEALRRFVDEVAALSPEEIVEHHGIAYGEAESLYASLLFYLFFLRETKATRILVPMTSIRDGVLLEQAELVTGYPGTDVSRLVVSSAKQLASKYAYDEKHSACVASIALRLFDELKAEHGLGARERLLLRVSAILFEIGLYVSPTARHKHSAYLIDASDIFGIRLADKRIVAQVARYHRRAMPKPTHAPYMSLPKQDRAIVLKLAALLRVAIAMDSGRDQRLSRFDLDRSSEPYVIRLPDHLGDVYLEREALVRGGRAFSEVFGVSLVMKTGSSPTGRDDG